MIDRTLANRARLLPAVMILAATLLAVKVAGLVQSAGAQETPAETPVSAAPSAVPIHSPTAVENETSSSEVDVLTSLARRRSELDTRAQAVRSQEQLLAAAEKRVDEKIAALKSLQVQLQELLGQRDAAQQKQMEALVKTYSSMKPRDAARIFNDLADDVLVPVSAMMKPDVLGAILAQMQPPAAQKLTVKLASRLKPAPAMPVQVATAAPAAREAASAPADTPEAALPASAPPGSASTQPTSVPHAKTEAAPAAHAAK